MRRRSRSWLVLLVCLTCLPAAEAAEIESLLNQVKAVGDKGTGNVAAQRAVTRLSESDSEALLPILKASNDANPLAMNWLRGAFEAIADRTVKSDGELPLKELEAFVLNTDNAPRIRRLAYEWLAKVDEAAPDRLIPQMLDDPSSELRRDAVARLIDAAKNAEKNEEKLVAHANWKRALEGAIDEDQVKEIVKALKEHGEEVDLVQHFGMLMNWKLIGPFDNKDMKGFDVTYPPEDELDFDAKYEGQLGEVEWKSYQSENTEGEFDIGALVFNHKGSATYATTTFDSDDDRDVEFRISTQNAWKLWLNGELLFAREEYHRGMFFDQYRVQGTLKPGENVLLLKVLQNEQDQDWAQDYKFTFRVTDLSGKAIRPADDRQASR
ncbi:MAG: hypothetical protein KDA93_16390 [Planctomycetaceae bacterium]|nr:hypothetical protein [Planctomycetaceae bacterium]